MLAFQRRRPYRCDLQSRDCKLHEGQRGACFVRQRVGDRMVLTYPQPLVRLPFDRSKKPLNHFYPAAASSVSVQPAAFWRVNSARNWDISKSREMDTLMDRGQPREAIAGGG